MRVDVAIPPGRRGERKSEGARVSYGVAPLAGVLTALLVIAQPVVGSIVGISAWRGTFSSGDTWSTGVTAMVWYTAIAVLAGSLVAPAFLKRPPFVPTDYRPVTYGSAMGAFFAIPPVTALSGTANVDDVSWPGLQVAISIPLGVFLGVLLTWVVFRWPHVVTGIWLHVAWVWFLSFGSVVLSWKDNVDHTVPLGAALLGGPDKEAAPFEHTIYGLASSVMALVALLGPIAVTCGVALWVRRQGSSTGEALAAGLIGPLLVIAAYLARPDVINGETAEWFLFAIRALFLSAVAVCVMLFLSDVFRQRNVDEEDSASPLVRLALAERARGHVDSSD